MKASEHQSVFPLGSRPDIAEVASGAPGQVGPIATEVSADAARFSGLLERPAGGTGTLLPEALGSLPHGGALPSVSSMPTMPSLAHLNPDTPANIGNAPLAGLESLQAGFAGPALTPPPLEAGLLPANAQGADGAALASGALTQPPAQASQQRASAPSKGGEPLAATRAEPTDVSNALPETVPGMPEVQVGPGPVLTPAQARARSLKRHALGLDGGAHAHKQAHAAAAQSATGLRDKQTGTDAAAAASGVVPPQPVQWTQPVASAPSAGVTVSAVAPLAQAGGAQQALQAPMSQAVGNGASIPAGAQSLVAQATGDVRLSVSDAAQEVSDTDALAADSLDFTGIDHSDMPGAPPAPVRLQREQKVIEAVVAEIQAQQVHLAVVNTPESSMLLEVLKKL